MKIQDNASGTGFETLGAGLVVVGIVLLNSNKLIGMLFIGFGLGYNVYPLMQKALLRKKK
ncbi:hypothetical protein DRN44_08505 [Thermococci archaeon]|nr:MAG: hypothetical protein DRN44_08505 [Thermococci archaeon]